MALQRQEGPEGAARKEALSVSAAMALAKGALEGVTVRLVGEVSELSAKPGYKAVYFTVKDASASLPCMMWNNRYQAAGVELRVGALVELSGRFTLYAAKGRMNFDVFSVALAGEGNLRLQVANLARKLAAEGLTDEARKRPLPAYPQVIGLVTSPRGAAVHDVLRTLRRHYPLARVALAGVPVEGAGAPAALIEGMQRVVMDGAEVVLLVRGGGSFEDLMPFNDEGLARAIAAMPVPVVTGIGHEPDTSIADMVSDHRASTPTAAASAAVPDVRALAGELGARAHALASTVGRRLERTRLMLERLAMRPLFAEPERLLASDAQTLDDLSARLAQALPDALAADRRELDALRGALVRLLPGAIAPHARRASDACAALTRLGPALAERPAQRAAALAGRLSSQGDVFGQRFRTELALAAARLDDLSPLAVLARGFSIARDGSGAVVRSVEAVAPGDALAVTVADGELDCLIRASRATTSVEPWKES